MWHDSHCLSKGFEDHLTVRDIWFSETPWGVSENLNLTVGLTELHLQLRIVLTIDKFAG